jgi:hypothetical protein
MRVNFRSFGLTEFQDTLETKYNTENVFGRMDPITTYQGTSRKIGVGLLLSATGLTTGQAEVQHQKISRLMRMQYPTYEKADNALSLSAPPLVAVSFANYIRSGIGGALLCAMNGFTYTPKVGMQALDSPYIVFGGFAAGTPDEPVGKTRHNATTFEILPTAITLKFNFTVLHEQPMGFASSDVLLPGLSDPWSSSQMDGEGMTFTGGPDFGPGKPLLSPAAQTAADKEAAAEPAELTEEEQASREQIWQQRIFGE